MQEKVQKRTKKQEPVKHSQEVKMTTPKPLPALLEICPEDPIYKYQVATIIINRCVEQRKRKDANHNVL